MTAELARLIALMHAANARVASMQAENQHRLDCGNSIAYGEDAFNNEAEELADLARQMGLLP